jgi:two-component system OmpR family sensor kinase
MTRYSLRTRLVAVVVAVTVFALLAGGLATWISLRAYLYGQLDGQLDRMARGRAMYYQGYVNQGATSFELNPNQPAFDDGPDDGGVVGQQTLINADGSIALDTRAYQIRANQAKSNGSPIPDLVLDLSSGDARKLADTQNQVMSITTSDGKDVLTESQMLSDGKVVAVALPVGAQNRILTRLVFLELAVSGAAVLAAVGLGAYGVRVGLQPLTRVSYTAREIAANLKSHGSGLERRVPGGDARTEVGQLTDAVNTMLSAAQVAYAQRVENEDRMRRFMADASHELRTPLTSLRGYAELERMRAATPGAEDADATKDSFRRIETEGDRMARLVDDLLLLARTDQGSSAPELGPVAVDELLDEAADRAGAAYPGRPFVIDTPTTGLTFIGDREVMLQVIGNLLRNAAIHTPGPRPIRLGARPDRKSVLLLIADEGPGMSPEQATHAFERFWRADSGRTRATGGSGLGLAIVHALITAQHGAVGLTSDVATGTTVLVRMPGLLDGLGRLVHQPAPDARYGDPLAGGPVAQPGLFVAQSPFGPPSPFDSQPPSGVYRPDEVSSTGAGRHAEAGSNGSDRPARAGRNHRNANQHRGHSSWWTREEVDWRGPSQRDDPPPGGRTQ